MNATTSPAPVTPLAIAESVVDPELPMLTLADLGVLREVTQDGDAVVVTITPTYSGCPAVAEMRADLTHALERAGYTAEVRLSLAPAWSTDDITEQGKAKLATAGIAPPGVAPTGPVLLSLGRPVVRCPRCSSTRTSMTSRFGPTACLALWRCDDCAEPFERVKEI